MNKNEKKMKTIEDKLKTTRRQLNNEDKFNMHTTIERTNRDFKINPCF